MTKKTLITMSYLLFFVLSLTKSLYIDWLELITIIVTLTIFSLYYQVNWDQQKIVKRYGITAIFSFVFCFIISSIDIIIDHFLYFSPISNEQAVHLTLANKFIHFSDDLLVASLLSFIGVISLTYILTKPTNYVEIA